MLSERATDWAAAGAATSWLWLPTFHETLQIALAILGVIWLTVQIIHKLRHWNDKK